MLSKTPARVRQRDRLAQLRLLNGFEKRLQKKVVKIFGAQGKRLAKQYEAHQEVSSAVLKLHQEEFVAVLKLHYRLVMTAFSERIRRAFKSSIFDSAIAAYIRDNALSSVDDIDDTTIKIIKGVISDGQEAGLTTSQIVASIVERTAEDVVASRAWVIARTEMHAAANFASVAAAKDIGIPLNKVWTSALDNRTREAHQEADGQSVDIDDDFNVDGEDVSQPGDGSAENSVNCRCVVIFEKAEQDDT
jgi:uncharacterized protein with gpF-like domain